MCACTHTHQTETKTDFQTVLKRKKEEINTSCELSESKASDSPVYWDNGMDLSSPSHILVSSSSQSVPMVLYEDLLYFFKRWQKIISCIRHLGWLSAKIKGVSNKLLRSPEAEALSSLTTKLGRAELYLRSMFSQQQNTMLCSKWCIFVCVRRLTCSHIRLKSPSPHLLAMNSTI